MNQLGHKCTTCLQGHIYVDEFTQIWGGYFRPCQVHELAGLVVVFGAEPVLAQS